MKKVKNIHIRGIVTGRGIVNFDSPDQSKIWWNTDFDHLKFKDNNIKYAKKALYGDINGDNNKITSYKVKISSDSVRRAIFINDVFFQNPNISHHKHVKMSFVASPAALLRGFMFAESEEKSSQKGAVYISDAIQNNNAISMVEIKGKSGPKKDDVARTFGVEIEEKADNTMFYEETIDRITYEFDGGIDIRQIQFISTDNMFGRLALNPDDFELYAQMLKTRMPSFSSELGYFSLKDTVVDIAEYGFRLSETDIVFLTRAFLKKVLEMSITRKGAYAKTQKLQYKLVYDCLKDTLEDENNWVDLTSAEDIQNINFEPEMFYVEKNEDEARIMRKDMATNFQIKKDNEKLKKAKKDAAAKAKKDAAAKAKKDAAKADKTKKPDSENKPEETSE